MTVPTEKDVGELDTNPITDIMAMLTPMTSETYAEWYAHDSNVEVSRDVVDPNLIHIKVRYLPVYIY